LLGRPDGFLGNPKVRIPLPGYLKDGARLLSALGQKKQVEELETAMNRAAENAVPQARTLLVNAVKNMSVTDAKQILTGGDTSVTEFSKKPRKSTIFRPRMKVSDVQLVDEPMAASLTPEVLAAIVEAIPDGFLAGDESADIGTLRASYLRYLRDRLAPPRAFVEEAISAR